MTDLLCYARRQPWFTAYYTALGIAGDLEDQNFCADFGIGTALEKNARLKSGTLRRVRAHSGYLTGKSGRLIAFSLIVNNHQATKTEIYNVHLAVLEQLAEY